MRMVKRSNECMGVLIEAGLDGDDLQAPVDNVDFREALISFWKARGQLDVAPVKESPSQQTARAIMGRNFLGIEDVQKRFDVTYTPEQLASLEQVPFTAEVLEECKDTHILFPGYPITILDIRQRTKKKAKKVFYADRDAWYNDQKFAKDEEVGLRWYLIRKDIVENSTSKTWDEQRKLLGPNEEVPQAAAVVYMIILYYLVTGIRLFERIYARCQDVTSFGSRVYVGRFGQGGLHVDSYWGDYRRSHIGLASSRK
jgi:hypothetical protein